MFSFRDPIANQIATVQIDPMSTQVVYSGDLDDCSKVRLQYPYLPDDSDAGLSEVATQFIWEGKLPTIEDYEGSLEAAKTDSVNRSKKAMTDAVENAAAILPNEKSSIEVVTSGVKDTVVATGKESQ